VSFCAPACTSDVLHRRVPACLLRDLPLAAGTYACLSSLHASTVIVRRAHSDCVEQTQTESAPGRPLFESCSFGGEGLQIPRAPSGTNHRYSSVSIDVPSMRQDLAAVQTAAGTPKFVPLCGQHGGNKAVMAHPISQPGPSRPPPPTAPQGSSRLPVAPARGARQRDVIFNTVPADFRAALPRTSGRSGTEEADVGQGSVWISDKASNLRSDASQVDGTDGMPPYMVAWPCVPCVLSGCVPTPGVCAAMLRRPTPCWLVYRSCCVQPSQPRLLC
jgi:hypothetical protein